MARYTHKKIKGILPSKIMPDKYALVLEGGGTRGCYTGGVLDTLLKNDIMFPYVIAVSAGSGNALSYISGQIGRNKIMSKYHIGQKDYVSISNLIQNKCILNKEYIFSEVPQKRLFFDWETFNANTANYLTGAFDCENGQTVWYDKNSMDKNFMPIVASTALPFICPMVKFKNTKHLDGGVVDAIPIKKSIQDGNKFHVIILTQNEGYRKVPSKNTLAKAYYKKYPKLIKALEDRYKNYNEQIEICEKLERDGKAIILRPKKPLEVGRLERDAQKLMSLYTQGEREALELVEKLSVLDRR